MGKKLSLVNKFAQRYSMEPGKLLDVLKATAFKQRDNAPVTNEQMAALMVVADQYGLNPFTREIYAFPDKQNGIVPVVGVDGWTRIINEQSDLDGIEFAYSEEMVSKDDPRFPGLLHPAHEWIECSIHRKGKSHPTTIREYLDEVYRAPFKPKGKDYSYSGPWQTHTRRFHRHKTLIQCARIAYGFAGIYDQDEAERIIEGEVVVETQVEETPAVHDMREALKAKVQPEPASQGGPAYSFIAEAINNAQNNDDLDVAASLIGEHLPNDQQEELRGLAAGKQLSFGDAAA